jgi:phage regulator Rha-like protein
MQTNQLIKIDVIDDTPVVSTMTISEHTERRHKDIISLIKKHEDNISEFGRVLFKTAPFETNGGTQNITVAELNEQQSTFLMTLLSNKGNVVEFKKNLVKAFFMMKERLQGNIQPVNQDIQAFMMKSFDAIVSINKNMESLLKTTIDTNNNIVRLKSEVKESLGNMDKKLEQVENRTKITAEISVRTDKVLGKTYNFLRYQPMTKKERKAIQNAVEKRAKEIAPYHNMNLDNTIASIYRALNKQYNVTTYNDLEHKDILSALDWIEFCELGTWKGTSTLKDPLEDVYVDRQKTNARDIDGNRIYDFDDEGPGEKNEN